MPYLYNAREFAINHIIGKEHLYDGQKGVFGNDYKLQMEKALQGDSESTVEDENENRLSKKMHSLFFPLSWQEALINSFNVMMMSGQIKSPDVRAS